MPFVIIWWPVFALFSNAVSSYSFNTENVLGISGEGFKNTYFAYSLVLQAGDPISSLLVGAPKNINSPSSGGNIYKCDIDANNNGSTCVQYPIGRKIDSSTRNGNFFGMSMDGESHVNGALVACAPRTLRRDNINYLRGYCVHIRNTSQIIGSSVGFVPFSNGGPDSTCCDSEGKFYYNLGFAMAGFDVSFYSQRDILLGAPGLKKFNGATIAYSLDNPRIISLLPYRTVPILKDEDSYFGYSVTSAKFQRGNENVWFVAGAPRADNLKGKVTVFFYDVGAKEKMNVVTTFQGEETGSYFGSSLLAADVTNDGLVDILVGAPMTSGETWDEGNVYFYKGLTERSFLRRVKLTGSSKAGSRFGTSIVSLGDFNLDGYNDVAISAPYEDDGRGAVYIYKGSAEGLKNHFSQRLSPADFKIGGVSARGFGMGMSKGNDIDGDGHNDIAIGAYKSDQVFIVKSYSIIDYEIQLYSDINSITNDTTSFQFQFCMYYTKRSDKDILRQAEFDVAFEIDYRSVGGDMVDQITVYLGNHVCKSYDIHLRQIMTDISPFRISLRVNTKTENIIANGKKSLAIEIPYSHGCGEDNICNTDLTLELRLNRDNLVLGLDKQIDLKIVVNNNGEPAYQCKVELMFPHEIELRNVKDCIKNNETYICLLSERLGGSVDQDFIFDVINITPDTPYIEIKVQVTSSGVNSPGNMDRGLLQIPIILENTPYIVGKVTPENMELGTKSGVKHLEIVHQFSVGKNGPSPLQVDVDILIPIVTQDGESIFDVIEVKGKVDTSHITCTNSITENRASSNDLEKLNISYNRTVMVACDYSAENCTRYSCRGEYLYNSGQLAVFNVRTAIKSNLLAIKYKRQLSTKDLIAFIPVAYQKTSTGRVRVPALFLIFVHGVTYVPLWVYLLAPSVGVILLILISYGLYKCHFFDRIYKDKLEQEKILGSDDPSVADDIFDDLVFRPMEENAQNKEKVYNT